MRQLIFSASSDMLIKSWNLKPNSSGNDFDHLFCKYTISRHDRPIISLEISKDERLLFSGDDGGAVHVWDLENRLLVQSFALNFDLKLENFSNSVFCLKSIFNSGWVVVAGKNGIQIFKVSPLFLLYALSVFDSMTFFSPRIKQLLKRTQTSQATIFQMIIFFKHFPM